MSDPLVRIARVCTECGRRVFSNPEWVCERHPRKTIDQANRPYFGKPTPSR